MKRIGAADRVRTPVGDHGGDPVRAVGGHVRDLRATLWPERVEEAGQGGLVPARRGPHQPTRVVVDHHGQILVPALVGDLIGPDPSQPSEPVV